MRSGADRLKSPSERRTDDVYRNNASHPRKTRLAFLSSGLALIGTPPQVAKAADGPLFAHKDFVKAGAHNHRQRRRPACQVVRDAEPMGGPFSTGPVRAQTRKRPGSQRTKAWRGMSLGCGRLAWPRPRPGPAIGAPHCECADPAVATRSWRLQREDCRRG
jgi:hypothetical protein